LSNLNIFSLQYEDFLLLDMSNSHSFSTHHFLLKFIYKACSVSGHVYVSYMYQFYLYIYFCAIFTYKMYLPYIRTDLISISYKQIFFLISSKFDMYCASCDNIPFWRWLKRQWTLTTYIYCNDFHGVKLSSLRNFNDDCTGEYVCSLRFESIIKFIAYTLKISTRFSMKNSLKMPKKKSEAIIRRTDNTMAKW
jgi:hypothetical protein